jgi:hypothetical protein
MELTHGELKAVLIAGKIPVADQALARLQVGLATISRGYHLNKLLRAIKTQTALRKELSRLYQACRTFLEVLDADLSGLGPDRGPPVRYFARRPARPSDRRTARGISQA